MSTPKAPAPNKPSASGPTTSKQLDLDAEGFLVNLKDWNKDTAAELANREQIKLTEAHWEIIECVRSYHQAFDHAPAMRPLTKYVKTQLGAQKSSSIYLLTLFPGSPAKIAAKIAGLPKPPNCL